MGDITVGTLLMLYKKNEATIIFILFFVFAAVLHPGIILEINNQPGHRKGPIYLFRGEADKIVPVVITRKKIAAIKPPAK
ncbi:MAG: hypothetical protein H7Y86_22020 [Rhizobacter sp.]|nr:hypothetical protein [Ferruginibacter sp.]